MTTELAAIEVKRLSKLYQPPLTDKQLGQILKAYSLIGPCPACHYRHGGMMYSYGGYDIETDEEYDVHECNVCEHTIEFDETRRPWSE